MFDGKEKEMFIKNLYKCFPTEVLIQKLREFPIELNKKIIIEVLVERGVNKDNLIFL